MAERATAEASGPVWAAGAVARRLGVAPTTLRSWHHRYGLGPSAPAPGGHRRYTEDDVAVLIVMARLVAQGVVPAIAAGMARDGRRPTRPAPGTGRPRSAAQTVRGIVRAASRLDGETLRHVLDESFATAGLIDTWDGLCVPALAALGRRTADDGVAAVLLLASTVSASLHLLAGTGAAGSRTRRALLACAAGERHTLGLEALATALTGRRVPVVMLGGAVAAPVLARAADRMRPALGVVWSQVPRTGRTGLLERLVPSVGTVVAAGPGWAGRRLPPAVVRVSSLAEATELAVLATTPGS
jgi:DNA-binding transcriptional MerR regulator